MGKTGERGTVPQKQRKEEEWGGKKREQEAGSKWRRTQREQDPSRKHLPPGEVSRDAKTLSKQDG